MPDDIQPVIKREVSIGNLLLVLSTCGAIAAGLWEGGRIQQTLSDGIDQERAVRAQENHALNDRIDMLSGQMRDVANDVRELRSYVMVHAQFPDTERRR